MNYKNNYLRKIGSGDSFALEFDPLPISTNMLQAYIDAAHEIESSKQGKIHVMYSGGVDSEYALGIFLHLGIDVTPVIVSLDTGYNSHDIKYAYQFCAKHNLTPLIINIDFDRFVSSGQMLEIAKSIRCCQYQYTATAYAAGTLSGTVICGDGEPYISKDEGTGVWNVQMREYEYALPDYFELKGIHGSGHFNRYTPEMMTSFLLHPRMKALATNHIPGKLGSNSSKWMIYNDHSPYGIVERTKYNGYELVAKSEIANHDDILELNQIGQAWNGIFREEYYTFLNNRCSS